MLEITLRGEQIVLLPERAMWWPAQKTLIVADLHWGKSAHFRKHGIAIPVQAQQGDEIKLAKLIKSYGAERLIIAGDLFHSRHNKEIDTFAYWRQAHQNLHIDMVTGNHDILSAEKYESWQLAQHKKDLSIGPFVIQHDMTDNADGFVIHGHLHPAIRLSGRGHHAALKLCCFCQDGTRMILPAFGTFTGNYMVQATDHEHIYVIAETAVIRWK